MPTRRFSRWHIAVVLASGWFLWGIPIVFSFVSTFRVSDDVSLLATLFIAGGGWGSIVLAVTVLLLIYRLKWSRSYALEYRGALGIFLSIMGIGFVGLIALYVDFGGPRIFLPHVSTVLFMIHGFAAIWLSKHCFKVNLF